MTSAEYNYGTLVLDTANGLHYIIDVGTKRRLYKLPICDLCGSQPYSFTGNRDGWACCEQHRGDRRERNDNECS